MKLQWAERDPSADGVDSSNDSLAARLGLPEPETMVRLNGLTMVAAGSALGLGIKPKLAQETQFLKNLGLMGGLLLMLSHWR